MSTKNQNKRKILSENSTGKQGESRTPISQGQTLYIFHRDLRIVDNQTLEAVKSSSHIIPLFIFTPEQVDSQNKFRSMFSINFMIESLQDLEDEIRKQNGHLYFAKGHTVDVVKSILAKNKSITAIAETADYTPFAKKRQEDMAKICKDHDLTYQLIHDTYLTEPGTILNGTGKTFQKFTPFWNNAKRKPVAKPLNAHRYTWGRLQGNYSGKLDGPLKKFTDVPGAEGPAEGPIKGGRSEGLTLLHSLPKTYNKTRDIPSERTSHLSAHHHFGTVSIRESYWAGKRIGISEFIRQLYWRDFYGHICNKFEELYGVSPYDFKGRGSWKYDREKFNKWTRGETGEEMVDAGIKQLLATGWIHNRVRLVVASYLVKDLKIYWRWGERFFAQNLVDYDFAQNFGNWCWVASVLPFSQAPFRRHDPETYKKRFNAEGLYVNKWLGTRTRKNRENSK
jgi:deoxyribodipyrimidine photo-lyase